MRRTFLLIVLIAVTVILSGCIEPPITCGNGICEAGETSLTCPQDCGTPQLHLECQNNQCMKVQGLGTDECATDVDCEPVETYLRCLNSQCMEMTGVGIDTCSIGSVDCKAYSLDGILTVLTNKDNYLVGETVDLIAPKLSFAVAEVSVEEIVLAPAEEVCSTFNQLFGGFEDDAFVLTNKIISASNKLCSKEKDKFNEGLLDLLNKRKELLLELIETDPAKALAVSEILPGVISSLTLQERNDFIEIRGEKKGVLGVMAVDGSNVNSLAADALTFNNPGNFEGVGYNIYYLKSGNKRYELFFAGIQPELMSGANVVVKGILLGDKMALESDSDSFVVESSQETSHTLGEQKTLVIIGTPQSKPRVPGDRWTNEFLENLTFGDEFWTLNHFFKTMSYDQVWFAGDVIGPYELNDAEMCVGLGNIRDMLTTAAAQDVHLPDYKRIILFLSLPDPFPPGCKAWPGAFVYGVGTVGLETFDTPDGEVEASISWNVTGDTRVWGHEMGHNFGLHHANWYHCFDEQRNRVPFSGNCFSIEYGDEFDVMGDILSAGHFHTHTKRALGWIPQENVIIVTEGTYVLKPGQTQESGIQNIKIPNIGERSYFLPSENVYYSISFVKPDEYSEWVDPAEMAGVAIHLHSDFTPGTNWKKTQATNPTADKLFYPGEHLLRFSPYSSSVYEDLTTGIRITLDSLTDEEAQVTIEQIPANPRAESVVMNVGQSGYASNLFGYLVLNVQNTGNGNVTTIVDHEPLELPVDTTIFLNDKWLEGGGYIATEPGNFRVYAALVDMQGNPLRTDNKNFLEDSYEFTVS